MAINKENESGRNSGTAKAFYDPVSNSRNAWQTYRCVLLLLHPCSSSQSLTYRSQKQANVWKMVAQGWQGFLCDWNTSLLLCGWFQTARVGTVLLGGIHQNWKRSPCHPVTCLVFLCWPFRARVIAAPSMTCIIDAQRKPCAQINLCRCCCAQTSCSLFYSHVEPGLTCVAKRCL
jgi:hypothetical protein